MLQRNGITLGKMWQTTPMGKPVLEDDYFGDTCNPYRIRTLEAFRCSDDAMLSREPSDQLRGERLRTMLSICGICRRSESSLLVVGRQTAARFAPSSATSTRLMAVSSLNSVRRDPLFRQKLYR